MKDLGKLSHCSLLKIPCMCLAWFFINNTKMINGNKLLFYQTLRMRTTSVRLILVRVGIKSIQAVISSLHRYCISTAKSIRDLQKNSMMNKEEMLLIE